MKSLAVRFYDPKVIERLFKLAELVDGTSFHALDAIRNLLNYAYLMDSSERVDSILNCSKGYLQTIHGMLGKALNLLAVPTITPASRDMCKVIVEQAFLNLEDLVHFLEADSGVLKALSSGQD